MKKKFLAFSLFASLFIYQADGQILWPNVTKEMKPWTRWWWMGSAVDRPNLERELNLFEQAGFGGVEVTPIYGAKGFEKRYIPFLSDKWMEMLKITTDRAKKLNLGVDMNLGTGWPFGGPQVNADIAATRFFLDEISLNKGDKLNFPLKVSDNKQTIAKIQSLRAFDESGKEINLDHLMHTNQGSWEAENSVTVIALYSGRTRQQVKRAAPGGEGFTLDHLGKESVNQYFNYFNQKFQNKEIGIRSFFNDSYEVYGANWTDSFLEIFEQKKHYKLQDYLFEFAGKGTDKNKEARIKSDYREVVDYVLKTNFLQPFTQFSNNNKALSRNQAHGSPGNLIDLYASTDIAECETFGSSLFDIPNLRRDPEDVRNVDPDPMMFKFASSATNLSGKKYTSSETFTWLTEHFKTSLSQAKPEVEQLFLSGVNHVFYHGATFSPQDAPYPGWLFYASVNFTPANSFWDHLPALNSYITRVQSILQTTKADNELLIYWPIYDIWNDTKAAFKTLTVHHVDDWLHPTSFYKQSLRLQKQGFSFDFISDAFIQNSKVVNHKLYTSAQGNPYKAIYIPATQYFSLETFKSLLELANQGATLIFESFPKDVEGFKDYEHRKAELLKQIGLLNFKSDNPNQYTKYGKGKVYLTNDVNTALETENIFPERLVRSGIKFSRRVFADDTYYYLVNHSKKTIDQEITLNTEKKYYSLLDPQTGKIFNLSASEKSLRIQIPSGYAWIILVSDQQKANQAYKYLDSYQEENVFNQDWTLKYCKGAPKFTQVIKLKSLDYWTNFSDSIFAKFSGTIAYETSIDLKKDATKSYLLQFENLSESARIFINNIDAGIIWSQPYQIDIADYLKDGANHIRIEVSNLMANRMRDLDQQKVKWKNYHEINFVNINYKEFDASNWKIMNSGLKGPIKLVSY